MNNQINSDFVKSEYINPIFLERGFVLVNIWAQFFSCAQISFHLFQLLFFNKIDALKQYLPIAFRSSWSPITWAAKFKLAKFSSCLKLCAVQEINWQIFEFPRQIGTSSSVEYVRIPKLLDSRIDDDEIRSFSDTFN